MAASVCYVDWHVNPFKADRWFEVWEPAAKRALSFGASTCTITRSEEDPLLFRQRMTWENKADFERYWYSDEIVAARAKAVDYFNLLLLPVWHVVVAD